VAMGYGGNLDTYDVDGELPRVEIKSGNGVSAVLTGMTMKGEGERVKGNLYDGSTAFEIAELDFAGAGATKGFKVAGLHYITDMRTKDDFVAISAKFGTGAVESEDVKNAAGIQIREVHYDFAFRRLHADTVEKIITSLRDAYGTAPEAAGPAALAMALQTAVIAPLKEHAGEILKHDPEFVFERVGVVTDEGEGVVKGMVKLVGVRPEDFSPAAIAGIVGKIDADITVEVAEKLVEKIPNAGMMTGMALDSGYFIREGDKLVCHIEFKNGELKVNGKALPVPGIPGMGAPPPPPELSPAAGA
jgi:uncharacterized protein YdgA (DUF945 family)